jgi:hypothetical protein
VPSQRQPLNSRTADTELLRSCLETDLDDAEQLQLEDHLGAVHQ